MIIELCHLDQIGSIVRRTTGEKVQQTKPSEPVADRAFRSRAALALNLIMVPTLISTNFYPTKHYLPYPSCHDHPKACPQRALQQLVRVCTCGRQADLMYNAGASTVIFDEEFVAITVE